MSGTYRTIVADPPWPYKDRRWRSFGKGTGRGGRGGLAYPLMSIQELSALPVSHLAAEASHLYLWATSRFLADAFRVLAAWGYGYSQTLVWTKEPMGRGIGGAFTPTTEFILFGRRGCLPHKVRLDSTWFRWPRTSQHSRKPDHFFDMVETVSPGPYLELFARRQRLGWDVWGNEVASTVDLAIGAD